MLEDVGHKFGSHAAERPLRTALREDFVVAIGLKHGHVVLFFVLADFATHAHTFRQEVHELVVELVDLVAKLRDALRGNGFIANHKQREDIVEHVGRHLLLGVAPCVVGRAVAFHDEAVEAQVHCLLRNRCNQLAPTANVARVGDDGQVRIPAAQLDGNLPHGGIAVNLVVVRRKTAMNGSEPLHAGGVQALEGSNPQLEVGIDGIFHENDNIVTLQRVGKGLHRKGIRTRASTYPKNINAVFQGEFGMFRRSHFGGDEHSEFVFHALQPRQSLLAVSLESAGFRAWFPHAGTEVVAAQFLELSGCGHHLFFSFCRARSCDDERALVVAR